MDKLEMEHRLVEGDVASKRMKKQLFDIEVMRTRESMKNAQSEHDYARHAKLEKYMLEKYNKYNNTNYRG